MLERQRNRSEQNEKENDAVEAVVFHQALDGAPGPVLPTHAAAGARRKRVCRVLVVPAYVVARVCRQEDKVEDARVFV